ncbi:MgtC/SapB family protein [Leucobacter sp. gxy201]|uniref:MgtC/SapB family protein n=1 Tax=Leucobacter sp. gxy201 TaxID=2957200 RepID=UPI003DA115E2
MPWWTPTSGLQLGLLAASFVLCGLIGLERQFRQKAAGFRTHVLVGTGSATFTLVSAYGFEPLLGHATGGDPSRIAAQVVSGIGFLGAGVIFTRRDVVRGLTTAATVWVAAAVGMACGAGMVMLAVGLTAAHMFALIIVGPLVAKLPNRDSNRVLHLVYLDGSGTLRQVLTDAAEVGFSAYILRSEKHEHTGIVELDVRFKGKPPLEVLIPKLHEVPGIRSVQVRHDDADDDE